MYCSTFASKFLSDLSSAQLDMYDAIINKPSNDWDIYHWIVSKFYFTFFSDCLPNSKLGGGTRVVVSTAAFHAGVRGSVPGGLKETQMFLPHPRVKLVVLWGASVTER